MTASHPPVVGVMGLGYVGLPLALSLVEAGYAVVAVDTDPGVLWALRDRRALFCEPGVAEALAAAPTDRFSVAGRLPDKPLRGAIICVGTAVKGATKQPDLRHLRAAAAHVADHAGEDTIVVVRSTVPVGTCRTDVLPLLSTRVSSPLLAMCPERTIQGTALAEIRSLPQIIGGIDDRSVQLAAELLAPVCPDQVRVSSLEVAEMVKLICNAHTDLIYGFGNEVALLAEAVGLDAEELISSANLRYPRPDLSRPGFVGGSCLVKDPYLLLHSGRAAGYRAPMVAAARAVNESLPGRVAQRVLDALVERDTPVAQARVLICGIAYKGRPPTDDVRGAAAAEVAGMLHGRVGAVVGHDFVVDADRIAALGFEPVGLDEGLREADALIILTDHPDYAGLDAERLVPLMAKRPVVFDVWGIIGAGLSGADDVTYLRLGRG